MLSTIAGGGGAGLSGYVNGSGTAARFWEPSALARDAEGNLYVLDDSNNAIRRVDPSGKVTTVIGPWQVGFEDGPAGTAQLKTPKGLAVDSAGNLYVADQGNHRIRLIRLK